MANLQSTTFSQTGFITLPSGTNAQRPTATTGMLRFNNQSGTDLLEFYDGTNWRPVTGYSAGTVGTGGQTISYTNSGIVHIFSNTGSHTFTPAFTGTVQVLVVGAGGGSGYDWAGGGGGGGVIFNRAFPVSSGTAYPVTVGTGGTNNPGGWSTQAFSGGNSVFSTITANGGGGSGSWSYPTNGPRRGAGNEGLPGGSGGGGGNTGDGTDSRLRVREGDGLVGQGYPGGSGVRFNTSTDNQHLGGSGGGAGGRGMDACDERYSENNNLSGGPGRATNILEGTLYFGGGGGGGAHLGCTNDTNSGGIGGGGGGSIYHGAPNRPTDARRGIGGGMSLNNGQPGQPYAVGGSGGTNTGGGAGGGQHGNSGGPGVVIIKY